MKVAIASDHAGFKLKESLRAYLQSQKHEVADMGTDSETSVDYPDFAKPVAAAVSSGDADMGVLICGSGIGMAITANRLKNVKRVHIKRPDGKIFFLGSNKPFPKIHIGKLRPERTCTEYNRSIIHISCLERLTKQK